MADKFDILTNISDGALLRRSGSTLVSLTPEQLAALDALTAAFQAKNASLDALAADTVPAGLEAVLDGRYVSQDATGTITAMTKLTQAEYDALGTPEASTFYVIVG